MDILANIIAERAVKVSFIDTSPAPGLASQPPTISSATTVTGVAICQNEDWNYGSFVTLVSVEKYHLHLADRLPVASNLNQAFRRKSAKTKTSLQPFRRRLFLSRLKGVLKLHAMLSHAQNAVVAQAFGDRSRSLECDLEHDFTFLSRWHTMRKTKTTALAKDSTLPSRRMSGNLAWRC